MNRIQKYFEHIALSIALGGALALLAGSPAAAQTNSCTDVRGAQQQLQSSGYYKGSIDGMNGPMTRSAIRQYQKDNGLSTNGRLDNATCNKLGLTGTGEANRTTTEPQTQNNSSNSAARNNGKQNNGNGTNQGMNQSTNNSMSNSPAMSNAEFKANVQSAQRQLKQKGLYNGPINGVMDTNTETAIRKYQENTGLNVTGRLDQTTINSLGISKSH